MAVEPENRVVARALERRWILQLEALEQVKRQVEQALQAPLLLSEEELEKIRVLGADLSALWEAPTTTNRDRKRLLRCLIEEVQLRSEAGRYVIHVQVLDVRTVGVDGRHLKLLVGTPHNKRSDLYTLPAIGFNLGHVLKDVPLSHEGASLCISLAATLDENTFNGRTSLQLNVKDLHFT